MPLHEITELILATVATPQLFDLAQPELAPQLLFDTGPELKLRLIWLAALRLSEDNGTRPTSQAVANQIAAWSLNQCDELTTRCSFHFGNHPENDDLLRRLLETQPRYTEMEHCVALLRRFLQERTVFLPVKRLYDKAWPANTQTPPALPFNLEGVLRRAVERIDELAINLGSREGWGALTPLYDPDLPTFPTHVLPVTLGRWVNELAVATQTPSDLAAMMALPICSAAIAKKVTVRPHQSWKQPVNIYSISVLEPGNRKSDVVARAAAPLFAYESQMIEQSASTVRQYRREVDYLEQRLANLKKKVAREDRQDLRNQLMNQVAEADEQLACLPRSVEPKLLLDDCTNEELEITLENQGGKIAFVSAEGGVFCNIMGHYTRGAMKFDTWLKGHTGEDLRIDRVTRDSVYVPSPAITTALAVQPEVLRGLGTSRELRGKGLLARFLYALPRSLLGRREVDSPAMSEETQNRYHRLILDLCHLSDRGGPSELRYSPEAQQVIQDFQQNLEPDFAPWGQLAGISDWAGKLAGTVVRLSGVLHVIEQAEAHQQRHLQNREQLRREHERLAPFAIENLEISSATVERAAAIGRYLLPHAQAAFRLMGMAVSGPPSLVPDAWHAVMWIQRTGRRSFTKRELQQENRARFVKAVEVDPVLDLLVEHNFVRCVSKEVYRPKGGRPASEKYQVNPRVFDGDIRSAVGE
jgi:hypothetical protein